MVFKRISKPKLKALVCRKCPYLFLLYLDQTLLVVVAVVMLLLLLLYLLMFLLLLCLVVAAAVVVVVVMTSSVQMSLFTFSQHDTHFFFVSPDRSNMSSVG